MIIVAIFTGKDSLGFISENTYELRVSFYFNQGSSNIGVWIDTDELRCEYSRVEKLLENWKVLDIKKIPKNTKESLPSVVSLITKSMRNNKLNILLN